MKINFNNVIFETSVGTANQLIESNNPEFVFSGRSNVGKSSLINKLFNRKHLARVSQVPGKTSTINFYKTDNLRFVDLPGYGYSKVSKIEKNRWKQLVNTYLWSGRNIRLIFQLIDIRHRLSKEDCEMINYFVDTETPFVVILTKADKLSANKKIIRLSESIKEIPFGDQIKMIPFSSITGEGLDKIKKIIEELI